MADWSDISDLWWLQPSRVDNADTLIRGAAVFGQAAERRTAEAWHREQAQTLIDQRRAALQTQQAKVEGLAKMSSYMTDVAVRNAWTDPRARAGMYALHSQYPQSLSAGELGAMDKMFIDAIESDRKAREALITPAQKDINRANALENEANLLQSRMGPLDEETARQIAQKRENAQILKATHAAPGETTTVYGAGGEPVVQFTRGGAGKAAEPPETLTVGTRTRMQEDLMSYADVAESLAYIKKHKDASDFGVAGRFKEIYAKIAGQLGMEVPKGTVSVRTAVGTLAAGLVRALRSDSNIGVIERNQLLELVPSAKDITESLPTALDKMDEVTRQVWGKSRRAAEKLQMKWQPAWLRTPQQLFEDYKNGRYGPPGDEAEAKLHDDLLAYHFGRD